MAALITSISPPRGRSGDAVTITGTGFAAANNTVELRKPDNSTISQTITTQSATEITLTVSGTLTENFQHLFEVTNDDDSTTDTHAWLAVKPEADLETESLAAQQPSQFEPLGTEQDGVAEAKDYERLVALVEFARDLGLGSRLPSLADGRLWNSSSDSKTFTASATALYYHPFRGNRVSLHGGTKWKAHEIPASGVSITDLSGGTASRPHDVYLYDDAGTLTLELVAWAGDTTEPTRGSQDGVRVKDGDTTRRLVGIAYLDASKEVTFDASDFGIWNEENRIQFATKVEDLTSSWTYSTSTFRQANGSSSNNLPILSGGDFEVVCAKVRTLVSNSSGLGSSIGIGIDSNITAASQGLRTVVPLTSAAPANAVWEDYLDAGRHEIRWLEAGASSGTTTWFGGGFGGLLVKSWH